MSIDPRLLRSFVVLAEELHFGDAAKRLGLAQPALSQQIHRLEQQVGSALYVRTSRVVELTDAGRAMLEPARDAIEAAAQGERAVREATRTSAFRLRVGVESSADDIIPTLSVYDEQHADIVVCVSRMGEGQGQELLAADHLDAFVGLTAPSEATSQSTVATVDLPLIATMRADDPFAQHPSLTLERLRRRTIATVARTQSPERFDLLMGIVSEGPGPGALSILEISAPEPAHDTILEEVGAGGALAFGPRMLQQLPKNLRSLPFDPPLSIVSYVSWFPDRSAAVDAFVHHLEGLHDASPTPQQQHGMLGRPTRMGC